MALETDITQRAQSGFNSTLDPEIRRESRGKAFKINLYKYPQDLGGEDLKHYVEFGITMRGKSKFLPPDSDRYAAASPTRGASGNMTAENISQAATGSAAIAVGAIAYKLTRNVLGKIDGTGGKRPASLKGTVAKAAGAAAVDAALSAGVALAAGAATIAALSASEILKPDVSYRISDVIALHLDGPPTVKYSVNYANAELGTLAGVLGGGVIESTNSPGASESATALGTALAALPGALGSVNIKNLLSARSGTALNPFKEVIFESVDFRTFAFKYKFFPKSRSESKAVEDIITLFKFHMHPEMSNGKLFFINPSEFNISYNFESGPNSYFHKFAPCVLTEMDVNYGGEQFSSFRDGTPTEVHVSLTFREKEILTKQMILDGF